MKEKPTTIGPRETPVRMWRLKSEMMIPNKKVDQGADGFIYSSYKKCYSPSRKFFYNSKCRSYIHIPEAKHGPKLVF